MVDVATDVGTAGVGVGELLFRFHLAKATAAPTKVATIPTTADVTSKIFIGSIGVEEGVGAEDGNVGEMGGLMSGMGVEEGVFSASVPAP